MKLEMYRIVLTTCHRPSFDQAHRIGIAGTDMARFVDQRYAAVAAAGDDGGSPVSGKGGRCYSPDLAGSCATEVDACLLVCHRLCYPGREGHSRNPYP